MLNRELEVEITPKNLFLMDIVQIWAPHQEAEPVLTSQVQVTFESQQPCDEVKNTVPCHSAEPSQDSSLSLHTTWNSQDDKPQKSRTSEINSFDRRGHQTAIIEKDNQNAKDHLGPKPIEKCDQPVRLPSCSQHVVSVAAFQDLQEEPEGRAEHRRSGGSSSHDSGGTESGTHRLREGPHWTELRGGFQRWGMDGLVHRIIRALPESRAPEVHSLCRTSSGCRSSSRELDREGQRNNKDSPSTQDDGSQEQSSTQEAECTTIGEVMGGARGVRGGDTRVRDLTPRGGSVLHASGKSPTEPATFGPRRGFAGSDHPSEEDHCQGRTVTSSPALISSSSQLGNEDIDYEFINTIESHNYHRECNRWIKKLTLELEEVMSEAQLFPKKMPRLKVLEVMCSEDSEITKQASRQGARAARFGLEQGDLQEISARRQLFQMLVRQTPQHLWYSPVCGPWRAWSRLNSTKSEASEHKVFNQRWENLWQLALAVVLYRFQQVHGRHFHLEQPFGSEMLRMPCGLVFKALWMNCLGVVLTCVALETFAIQPPRSPSESV